jgi:TonB-linked SusC/RagA family outer membrane protein
MCSILRHFIRSGILLLALLVGNFATAQTVALSTPFPTTIDLPKQEVSSLKTVLNQLETKHDVRFNYASQLVEGKRVNPGASEKSKTLDEALENLLSPLGLRHEKISEQIYGIYPVVPSPKSTQEKQKVSEEQSFYDAHLKAIDRMKKLPLRAPVIVEKNVSGTVVDENEEPLPGVNVLVKATTIGTVTDIDGNFRLTVPDDAQTLVFSSVGYTTQEIDINGRSVIDLTMAPDVQALSEVVVVGYGTQEKSDLTGAISSVESEDITRLSERRLETALQGRAAGVQVMRTEGNPGAPAKVNIRGSGSIGNTDPLWIVDGVPMDPGNFFNPNDVESMEILKDASAAAIYGARAAHGVILVTTKRGAEGRVKVNFNTQVGRRQPRPLPNMLGTVDFVRASSIARINAGQDPEPAWDNPESLPNTNWVDEVFDGSGIEQMHNLSISGGNENASFFISGAYDREEGVMINNWFERFALRANSDYKIGKRVRIGESLLVSRTRENPTANDGGDLQTVFRAIPIMPVRDESNPFGGWGTAASYFQGPNPVAVQMQNHILQNINRINGNVYAEVDILSGLMLRGSVGANIAALQQEHFAESFNYGALSNPINSLTMRSRDSQSLNTNLVLTYNKSLGRHDFTVMGGYERFRSDGIDFAATAQDFPVNFARSFALATGAVDISERQTIDDQYRLESIFGRINYSFDNKYLLSASVRRDGSSRFGPEFQHGVFPSFSAGWRIVEEGFMQNANWLSDLKLRASWGVLGSDRIGNYIFSRTYTNIRSTYAFDPTGQSGGNKVRGFYLSRSPNREVKWEEIVQTDIGVDIGLLDGRFNITADYYIKNTTDMLIGVELPPSSGISQENRNPEGVEINYGEVENRGFELALNYRQNVGDWTFDITGNASWNQNEVRALDNNQQILTGGGGHGYTGNTSITEAGRPMGTFFGLIADGIFQSYDEIRAHANQGSSPFDDEGNLLPADQLTGRTAPGDLRYRDINNDGVINNDDRTYIGNPWPEMFYGLNANITFRNFDFTVFFQGVQGVDLFNAPKAYTRTVFSDYNTSDLVFEAWTPENPTEHPRLIATDPNGNFRQPSTYHIEDGSFLRLRNIQLGYTLPNPVLDRLGLAQARIFVNAQNILTFTNYEGIDPEVVGNGNNTQRGVDHYRQYPQTTLVSAGLQLGF